MSQATYIETIVDKGDPTCFGEVILERITSDTIKVTCPQCGLRYTTKQVS